MIHSRLRPSLVLWALVVALGSVSPVAAQPPTRVSPDDEPTFNEQTIYIPYTKLREVFEKEQRGVFLPYEKFQELWKAARENQPKDLEAKPPVESLINEVSNEAVVSRDVVKVAAKVQIELLGSGWHDVPLRWPTPRSRPPRLTASPRA